MTQRVVAVAWICPDHRDVRVVFDRTEATAHAPRCEQCGRWMKAHRRDRVGGPWTLIA